MITAVAKIVVIRSKNHTTAGNDMLDLPFEYKSLANNISDAIVVILLIHM